MSFYYNREPEDDEYELIERGWRMVGLAGWNHPLFGSKYFSKEQALAADTGSYHPIEREHQKMLEFISDMSVSSEHDDFSDWRKAARELLVNMKHSEYDSLFDEMGCNDGC